MLRILLVSLCTVVAISSSASSGQLQAGVAAGAVRGNVAPAPHAASRSACAPATLVPVLPGAGSLVWRACDGSVFARFDYGASTVAGAAYNETTVSASSPQSLASAGGIPSLPGTHAQAYLGLLGHSGRGLAYAAPKTDRSQIVSAAITQGASYELVGYAVAPLGSAQSVRIFYQSAVYTATSSRVLYIKSPLAGLTIPGSVQTYFALLAVPPVSESRPATTDKPETIARTTTQPSLILAKYDNSDGAWAIGSPAAQYALAVGNIGGTSTVGTITVTDTLPSGLQLRAAPSGKGWTCAGAPGGTIVSCTSTAPIGVHADSTLIAVPVKVGPSTPTGTNAITNTAFAYGGGDPVHATAKSAVTAKRPTTIDRPNVTKMIFLTDTAATSWLVPSDWNPDDNTIELIGGGGPGGGGGGAYSKVVDTALTPGSTVGITVGDATGSAGGGDTYMCLTASNCSSLTANAVIAGAQGGLSLGGAGGSAAAGLGVIRFSGGVGYGFFDTASGGGGGAAGRHGNGGSAYGGNGGAGDAGFGGKAGSFGDGGNGTEFDAAHGSGGGGGYGSDYGGNGGTYGAGGGEYYDQDSENQFVGSGSGGIIAISYIPTASPIPAALRLTEADDSGSGWVAGAPGAQYTLTVGNAGTAATVGTITVTDTLPAGLHLRATPSGKGWTCKGLPAAVTLSCTSTTSIPSGASGTPITIPVSVGPTTTFGMDAIANIAYAYGGGDPARSTLGNAARAQKNSTTAYAPPVNLYIADTSNNAIEEIPAGSATPVTLGSGFHAPFGVAVDAGGNVYVADYGNNAVKEILAAGGYTKVKTLGSGFAGPAGVAVDASGNVYVADSGHNAVREILAAGGYTSVKTLGKGFYRPWDVAVDRAGNVFVADENHNAVKEILAAGGYTTVKTLGAGFPNPEGVAVDGAGNVFVGDLSSSVVYEILAAGGYTTVKMLGSGFGSPSGVAVDGAGNVYVADFSNVAVYEILPTGGYTTIESLGTLGPGFNSPASVAVGPAAPPPPSAAHGSDGPRQSRRDGGKHRPSP